HQTVDEFHDHDTFLRASHSDAHTCVRNAVTPSCSDRATIGQNATGVPRALRAHADNRANRHPGRRLAALREVDLHGRWRGRAVVRAGTFVIGRRIYEPGARCRKGTSRRRGPRIAKNPMRSATWRLPAGISRDGTTIAITPLCVELSTTY